MILYFELNVQFWFVKVVQAFLRLCRFARLIFMMRRLTYENRFDKKALYTQKIWKNGRWPQLRHARS